MSQRLNRLNKFWIKPWSSLNCELADILLFEHRTYLNVISTWCTASGVVPHWHSCHCLFVNSISCSFLLQWWLGIVRLQVELTSRLTTDPCEYKPSCLHSRHLSIIKPMQSMIAGSIEIYSDGESGSGPKGGSPKWHTSGRQYQLWPTAVIKSLCLNTAMYNNIVERLWHFSDLLWPFS